MPIPIFRIVAALIPLQLAAVLGLVFPTPKPPATAEQADRIVITKSTHTMVLYSHGAVLRTYKVALGRGGSGPKQ